MKRVKKYIRQVKSGKIPAGLYLKLAVERFEKDLKNKRKYKFREEKFLEVVNFISQLKHFTDVHAGKPFILEPWQLFIIANLYGFYHKDGRRRFKTAYIEIARKNGKTALIAALALYHLKADGEGFPEILIAANSKGQAKIGFSMVKGFSDELEANIPEELRRLRRHHSDVNLLNDVTQTPEYEEPEPEPATPAQGSLFGDLPIVRQPAKAKSLKYRDRYVVGFIKNLASDSSKLDGYNCSLGIIDEYHAAKNSQVRDVIRSSQAMRSNPLLITITTAGFDKSSPCAELRQLCVDILSNQKEDDSFFTVIYSLDAADNWQDPAVWEKANPNLGITVKTDFLADQVNVATNSPRDETGVKTKNFNIWCDTIETWIPDEYIIRSSQKLSFSDYQGFECFAGVDLASTTDLTAVSFLIVQDNVHKFITHYYLPADTLKTNSKRIHADKNLYREWYQAGYLKLTPGNVTDYDYITNDLLTVNQGNPIQVIFYDRYNANSWAIQCTDQGLNVIPFAQAPGNFNSPTKEFERLVLSGHVEIDDNPITRYCLRNVSLRRDYNGNVKPMKDSDRKKIDGVIAMIQALAAKTSIDQEDKGTNIY